MMRTVYFRLFIAFMMTLLLSIFPLPETLNGLRPPLILLLLIYLQCFMPAYYHLIFVVFVGLCMDVLLSTVMGEHAFAFLLVGWIINNKSRRFQFFTIGQQITIVGLLCFIYQASILVIDAFSGFYYSWFMSLANALIGMLFWPWIKLLADDSLSGSNNIKENLSR